MVRITIVKGDEDIQCERKGFVLIIASFNYWISIVNELSDETGTMVGCVIASSFSAIAVFSSGAPIPCLLWGIGAITLIVCRWAGPFLRFLFPLAKIFFVGSASNFNQFPVPLFLVAFI